MTRQAVALLLGAGLLVAAPAPASADRFAWWLDPAVQERLQLTAEQVARVSQIFESSLPERRRLRAAAEALEADLARALAADDEVRGVAIIDSLAAARAAHGRARTLMVWRIYRALAPPQRRLLKDVQGFAAQH